MQPLADHTTDLLQGWGTVVGDVINVLAVLAAGAVLWFQIKSRNDEVRDAEAGQARLVIPRIVKLSGEPGKGLARIRWEVHNYSGAPIPTVMVFVGRRDEHEGNNTSEIPEDHLAPGGVLAGELVLDPPIEWAPGDEHPPLNYIRTITEFMDAAGLIWHREDREPPRRKVFPPDPSWYDRWRQRRWLRRHQREIARAKADLSARAARKAADQA